MRLLLFVITNSPPFSNPFSVGGRSIPSGIDVRPIFRIEFEANRFGQPFRLFVQETIKFRAEGLSGNGLVFLLKSGEKSQIERAEAESLYEEIISPARDRLVV